MAAYQVSGEYALLFHGAKAGAIDLKTGLGTLSTGSGTGFLFPDPICWSGRQVRVFQSPSVGQGDRSVLSGQETGPETGF